ncbi:MAG: inosine/xanthosine triphosphatase [Nanoarchaeota archaeon]|nr:inosine/xanthosine triphosphatase [Nanoarchaeota archaeon]
MKINIASKNPVKIKAVREVIPYYEILRNSDVVGVEVESGVSRQPMSCEETIIGARNRSRNAFFDCGISFGIEGGLMKTSTGLFNICFCSIYDGKNYFIGMGGGFKIPQKAEKFINEGKTLEEAFYLANLTSDRKIGSDEGAISILSNGRINRQNYIENTIKNALMEFENSHLYK